MAAENVFVMTVDVDGWSSLLRFYHVKHDPLQADGQINLKEGIQKLLQLFDEYNLRATFFVTGEMTRKHVEEIRRISRSGHEIACHGLAHDRDECLLDLDRQREMIEQAAAIVQQKTGCRPYGFRAPCLRANAATLQILEELGFAYDSSLLPTFVPGYYGRLATPMKPYHPSLTSATSRGPLRLLEIPVSVNPVWRIPLGAAWMRNLGATHVKLSLKMNFALRNPVVLYVHPRDVIALPKTKGVPWHVYKNAGDPTIGMLEEIFGYAESLGARFLRALELAEKSVHMTD